MFYNSFSIEIRLITHDEYEWLVSSYFPDGIDPFVEVGEWVGICLLAVVLVISKTMIAALESLMYEGMREWNLYCPAVSHNCILKLLFSTVTVLDTKSTPTVGWLRGGVLVRCRWSCRRWSGLLWMSCRQIGLQEGRSCTSLQDYFTYLKLYILWCEISR